MSIFYRRVLQEPLFCWQSYTYSLHQLCPVPGFYHSSLSIYQKDKTLTSSSCSGNHICTFGSNTRRKPLLESFFCAARQKLLAATLNIVFLQYRVILRVSYFSAFKIPNIPISDLKILYITFIFFTYHFFVTANSREMNTKKSSA